MTVGHAQGGESHIQLSSQGQTNNVDSLVSSNAIKNNPKYQHRLKKIDSTGLYRKLGQLKDTKTVSAPASLAPLLPKTGQKAISKYQNRYGESKQVTQREEKKADSLRQKLEALKNTKAVAAPASLTPLLPKVEQKAISKYQDQYNKSKPIIQREQRKADSLHQKFEQLKNTNGFTPSNLAPLLPQGKQKYLSKYQDRYDKVQNTVAPLGFDPLTAKFNALKIDSSVIHNNKYTKKYYDSIRKTIPAMPQAPFQNLTKEQMVKEVNRQFLQEAKAPADSLPKVRSGAEQLGKNIDTKVGLARAKIQPDQLQELVPMAGTVVKSKHIKKLDSLRKIDLKAQRLKLQEEETGAKNKVASLKAKETVWQKSYFEGVIGIPQGYKKDNYTILQLSPSLAYHLSSHISVGAGPSFLIKKDDNNKMTATSGGRVFVKASFYQRHLYAQGEDQINPNTVSLEKASFTQHNIFAGGGYILPFFEPLAFNVSLMYRFYSNGDVSNASSPWLFRVGISTKHKTKN